MADRPWPPGVTEAEVLAGGGIVVRDGAHGTEVVVVHRPRYDDWSLPKGKVDPGEAPLEAALREVVEETGLRAVALDEEPAAIVRYVDNRGRPKEVRYWVMRPARPAPGGDGPGDGDGDGGGDPGVPAGVDPEEVDRVEWWPLERARAELTYAHDRELLATVSPAPSGRVEAP